MRKTDIFKNIENKKNALVLDKCCVFEKEKMSASNNII